MTPLKITHLGDCGLQLEAGGSVLAIDPPHPVDAPTVLTWSETERIAGAREAQPPVLAADSILLAALGRHGTALPDGAEVQLAGIRVRPRAFTPIPWATPTEFVRKTWAALRNPTLARERMARTWRRPDDPVYALRIGIGGWTVAYLHQALHRFQKPQALEQILRLAKDADVVLAGTDYDDECATAAALGRLDAPWLVLVDLVGPVRRKLGLPTRPIAYTRDLAPPRTLVLEGSLSLRPEGP